MLIFNSDLLKPFIFLIWVSYSWYPCIHLGPLQSFLQPTNLIRPHLLSKTSTAVSWLASASPSLSGWNLDTLTLGHMVVVPESLWGEPPLLAHMGSNMPKAVCAYKLIVYSGFGDDLSGHGLWTSLMGVESWVRFLPPPLEKMASYPRCVKMKLF